MHLNSALFTSKSNNRQIAKDSAPKRGLFWATRTRILVWYVLTITIISIVSIPIFRELLYIRVDERVRKDLVKRILVFNTLIENEANTSLSASDLAKHPNFSKSQVFDPRFVRPSSHKELKNFFDLFLSEQLPEDETFFMTFVDGKFYKSNPRGRPEIFDRDTVLMRRWAKLVKPERGEQELADPKLGGLIYITQPVKIRGKNLGVFVIAHTVADERQETIEATTVVVQVMSVVMLGALMLAWIASGKVLAPLRSLSTTVRSVSESDLSQRVPVYGKDELADLASTFNDMMDRLEAAFTTQRYFINDAGQELRTPITIIQAYLQLICNDAPEEVEKNVTLVFDELDRMSSIVEDLIILAKAERPDFLNVETVDVSSFSEELFAKAQASGERNWRVDRVAVGDIVVDPERLTQAFMNLVQNAIQHTKSTDKITIGSSITQNTVKFWVRDTGEGIDEQEHERIFERFARASSIYNSQGTGLGLSIVKIITEAHDGKVILHSKLGEGANFCMVLPVEPINLK
ncbi:HAMP domain-containing sensor histidine kinase [Mastigocoleus testarum]|uniref:histidine kinase n=1 Tax=Mastigocoleus testarum BC008 TaxID=371196 RepID=A0A0V8A121_9CYAN|nr:HAMP domain-containing sensor histidine kinase [Mastigocoleus testarum]KST65413.1 ATPase [Mastigocoleus testarum BC008]KST70490.1 ATPase [Mastigocoleus testarum BC008]